MTTFRITLLAVTLLVGGCEQTPSVDGSPGVHGRYIGIGIRDAGRVWAVMKLDAKAKNGAVATIADDETVIVVADSITGEVRQCGSASGYCVRMNPWSVSAPVAPATLTKHAAEFDAVDHTVADMAADPMLPKK